MTAILCRRCDAVFYDARGGVLSRMRAVLATAAFAAVRMLAAPLTIVRLGGAAHLLVFSARRAAPIGCTAHMSVCDVIRHF